MRALSMEPTSPLLVNKGGQTIYVDYFDVLRSSANAYISLQHSANAYHFLAAFVSTFLRDLSLSICCISFARR